MAKRKAERDEITVILPPGPPELNPEAAGALLRILPKAREKQLGSSETDTPGTPNQPSSADGVADPGAPPS